MIVKRLQVDNSELMDNLKLMVNFEFNGLNCESKGMMVNVFNVYLLCIQQIMKIWKHC